MNDFKKIVPKKQDKKRATSVKRNNSFNAENKSKKSMNSERFFTTYEVFEKLNSKLYKKKFRANSSSKKKKKSKIKNYLSLEQSKKKNNNIENYFTNNTYYTTLDTDYIKNKIKIKNSPRKEKFSKVLSKAKELLSIQSDILIECGKLNKNLAKSDIEIETKLKNEINNNGTNILPGLAKALYLLECKKENKDIKNIKYNNKNNKNIINFKNKEEKMENSFYIIKFNELNGFIGELGYSYVYNEFNDENYKKENLIIYFENIQKLINMLHQTVNDQNEILIRQNNQIKEYENIINNYQKNLKQYQYDYLNNKEDNNKNKIWKFNSDLISRNSKKDKIEENKNCMIEKNIKLNRNNQHILINENISNNDGNINNSENYDNSSNNNYTSTFYKNINSQEFDKIEESKNIFKNNSLNDSNKDNENPGNTHYYNSYINQLSFHQQNNENENSKEIINYNKISGNSIEKDIENNYMNYIDKKENKNKNNKQSFLSEIGNNNLNCSKEQNILSSMINSGSFFESYKRNKELKHNLNFNYNDRSINEE